MAPSFLLRFQESCEGQSSTTNSTGTQTHTKILKEQPDSDPQTISCRAVPMVEHGAGTMTHTRVRQEQADSDHSSDFRTVPVQVGMGTATKTAVKMEADDLDPRQQDMAAIPRCSLL